MAPNRGKDARGPRHRPNQQPRGLKRKRDVEDIEQLVQRVAGFGTESSTPLENFEELPLSQPTQDGLRLSHFTKLTTIQARGIPVSLKGLDILGAAKTGSGKTLAFLVPVLENLYRKRWTEYDGVGALILSPTRELAIQIFDVLRKIGRNHSFSAGLVIGGKSLQEERDRLGRMNILVATPGRMLQHMDQTADLDIGNLQMLVLDEADRIMDMGFKATIDAIVDHLPKQRQTLMFSATQTNKVSDLARLSLTEPEFVSVHEATQSATPATLQQNYVVTPLPEKLDTLWSFIRANLKKKTLVFLSSGKQVRFVYEAFRHLQPGLPLLHLHGRQKQTARLDITTKFSNSKYACLFSTDVSARGLDFPAVDWVVQVDCPEDADTYIHRVGRTARYERDGRAVLFLDPSEQEGMLAALEKKRVTGVEQIHVRQKRMQDSIQKQLQHMCFQDPELRYLGQKAFVSYVRSVFIQKDKSVFDVKKLDLEKYASSMGLPGAPRVKFVKGEDAKLRKNMPRALAALENDDGSDSDEEQQANAKEKPAVRTKYDRMFERRNQDVLAEHYSKLIDDETGSRNIDLLQGDADEDNEFLAVRQRIVADDDTSSAGSDADSQDSAVVADQEDGTVQLPSDGPGNPTDKALQAKKAIKLSHQPDAKLLVVDSNRRAKILKSKKALLKYKGSGSHVVFASDEEDNQGKEKVYYSKEDEFARKGAADEQRQRFVATKSEVVKAADEVDREVAREKRREKKIKRKERARAAELDTDDDVGGDQEYGVQLTGDAVHVPVNLGPYSDTESDEQPKHKDKKPRKWFQDPTSSSDEATDRQSGKKGRRRHPATEEHEPQTLEDLEAMASGLLAGDA